MSQEFTYVLDLEQVKPGEFVVTVQRTVKHTYRYVVQSFTMRGSLDVLLGVLRIRYPQPVVLLNGVLL